MERVDLNAHFSVLPNMRLPALLLTLFVVSPVGQAADQGAPGYTEMLKIDVHSHVFEDIPALVDLFQRSNLRTINVCVPGTDGHLETMNRVALELYHKYPTIFPFTTTFDLRERDQPGWRDIVLGWLNTAFANGAVGVKIWKEVGLELKKPDGSFLLPDDPMFDAIYAHIEAQGKVLQAHLAEPIDAWLPLDPNSAHYNYYSQNPQWHLYGKPEFPSHAAIIAARDHILEKHPHLVMVAAHLASLEHDLDGIAARFERFPNLNIDTGARTRNLTRHPTEKVRAFFLKYQDRILYGVDQSWKPYLRKDPPTDIVRQAYVKRLEVMYRADWDYYAGKGEITYNGRKVEALNLPRDVLEKFYHGNAERIFKLKQAWEPRKK
jgi:predicted TIM-barrel fold metal-dependent hydrolase